MSVPKFEFRLKDAASRGEAKRFVDALIGTGRFKRNEKSQILFEVAENDHVMIVHKQGLRSILEDAGAIEVTGDLGDSCTDLLWFWLLERKWTLPRIGGAWSPPKPPGVSRVGYEFVRHADQVRK